MLSAGQIKAARAMLGWTQDEMAQNCGLSLNTINSLENGNKSPRSSIAVRRTLEEIGFEFIGSCGLSRRSNETRTYEGEDSCDRFCDDLLATSKQSEGEILIISWSQELLTKAVGAQGSIRLERLKQIGQCAKVKCLLIDAPYISFELPFFEIRGAANYLGVNKFPTFIYGNKTALVIPGGGNEFTHFIMKSTDIAQQGAKEFYSLWGAAYPLSNIANPIKYRS